LDAAARASEPLRGGLTEEGARTAARRIRALLGAEAVAIVGVLPPDGGDGHGDCGREGSRRGACSGGGPEGGAGRVRERPRLLAWDGAGRRAHAGDAVAHALPVLASGRPEVIAPESIGCTDPECTVKAVMVAPLTVEGRAAGALTAYWPHPSAARVRAAGNAARLLAGQLELAGLDAVRTRLAEAEMRALRAQISPHFVYNSLTTIASFVRTDPQRARELLLDFADFA